MPWTIFYPILVRSLLTSASIFEPNNNDNVIDFMQQYNLIPEGMDDSIDFRPTDQQNRTPFLHKNYMVDKLENCSDKPLCATDASTGDSILLSDRQFINCLEEINSRCVVHFSGWWNYTLVQPPNVCVANNVAMKLPIPADFVEPADCTYNGMKIYGLQLEKTFSQDDLARAIEGKYCDNYYRSHNSSRLCTVPSIYWTNKQVKRCSLNDSRAIEMIMGPNFFKIDDFDGGFKNETRINLSIDIESTRKSNRNTRIFLIKFPGIKPRWNTGTAYATEMSFTCKTNGRMGLSNAINHTVDFNIYRDPSFRQAP